jgi:hypothetical protein
LADREQQQEARYRGEDDKEDDKGTHACSVAGGRMPREP